MIWLSACDRLKLPNNISRIRIARHVPCLPPCLSYQPKYTQPFRIFTTKISKKPFSFLHIVSIVVIKHNFINPFVRCCCINHPLEPNKYRLNCTPSAFSLQSSIQSLTHSASKAVQKKRPRTRPTKLQPLPFSQLWSGIVFQRFICISIHHTCIMQVILRTSHLIVLPLPPSVSHGLKERMNERKRQRGGGAWSWID